MHKKSTEYKEINRFLSSFNIIQHSEGSTVLASQNNTFLVRNIDIQSSDEYQKLHQLNEIINTLSTHQSFNCKNILPLINFDIIFNKTKTQSQIRAIYYYGRKPLSKQIQQRKDSDQHFEEDALWSLLFSLASPLAYLQQKSIIYGVLDSTRVFLDNDTIAIMDPSSTGIDPYEIMTNRLYSPQLLKSQQNYDQINMFKSDVFVLGLLMLQCALLKMQIYDYDENILQICLKQIKDFYSQTFCQLIELMITFNPEQRPSFEQILTQVNEIFEISITDVGKIQSMIPDQEDQPNQTIQMQEYNEVQNIDILQTQYIRFQDHNQNRSSLEIQKGQLKFYNSNSQLSQSPINQSSEISQNSSLLIQDSLVKSLQKSRRLYKPKQIKQKLIKKDHQFHSLHQNQHFQYDSYQKSIQNTNQSHRRTKTDFQPNLQKNYFNKNNRNSNEKKIKQSKQNQSHHHNFTSGAVFSPLNKENLFTKPEILNMIKHDMRRIQEKKKKSLNVNFSYFPENQQKKTHNNAQNQRNEEKISSNHRKVQSFHQISINSNQR